MTRPRDLRAGVIVLFSAWACICLGGPAAAAPSNWSGLVSAMEGAWSTRDAEAFADLGGTSLPDDRRRVERAFAAERFLYRDSVLSFQLPASVASYAATVGVDATLFLGDELSARVEQWRFDLERRPTGWIIVRRTELGSIDGLIQLVMDPTPRRAEGLVLRLEDFELRLTRGHLFTTPEALGAAAFVFVGSGEVEVRPRPVAERERLRRFCGSEVLRDRIRAAFVRVRPEELGDILSSTHLAPDAAGVARRLAAERFWKSEAPRAFVLDTPNLPRSPWWLSPSSGGALVTLDTHNHGVLTFVVSPGEAEDINLFDRRKKLQLLMYGSGGRKPRFDEDDRRGFDLEHLDLSVSFEPGALGIQGRAKLRFRPISHGSTLRLRLEESLRVESVSFGPDGMGVAARVRGQSSIVIPLPPSVAQRDTFEVEVRYSGRLDPMAIQDEAQIPQASYAEAAELEMPLPRILVYSNRSVWYPRNMTEDYATSRVALDVPRSQNVLSGGALVSSREESGRRFVEYRQDKPAKYLTATIGRFDEVATRESEPVRLRAFATPLMKSTATKMIDELGRILDFFAQEFGPCPYTDLSLLVFEGETPGGHSPAGLLILQERPPLLRRMLAADPANFSDVPGFILAHEAAHQWWGQGVAGENYRERWLVEGAAQYAASRWVREQQGSSAHASLLRRFHKWALASNANGPLHLGQRLGQIEEDPRVYKAIVYDKGAAVFEALRSIAGEEAWNRAIHAYQETHRYAKAGSEDFREALEAASGQHLEPFFESWVYGTQLPTMSLQHRTEPGASGPQIRIEARTTNLPGEVPLRLRLNETSGPREVEVRLRPGANSWSIALSSSLRSVEPNSDRALLFQASAQR